MVQAKQSQTRRSPTIDQVWELSKLWYHNRLSIDYHGRTIEQAEEIFKKQD